MTVRALAHPVRLDLIEVLATLGPSTAARCGRHLGVSQASCSFHLRQLAKYGFVEEAEPGPDRRERVWRLSDVEQSWQSGPVTDQLDRVFAQREADRMLGWTARRAAEPARLAGRGVPRRRDPAGHRRRAADDPAAAAGRARPVRGPNDRGRAPPGGRPIRPAAAGRHPDRRGRC